MVQGRTPPPKVKKTWKVQQKCNKVAQTINHSLFLQHWVNLTNFSFFWAKCCQKN